MDKKTNLILTILMSIFFTIVFTFVGAYVQGALDMATLPIQLIGGFIIGLIVGIVIPAGDLGGAIASKICPPGSKGFTFVMFNVILLIMLIFMCPLMTILFGSVLGGAPVAAVLPGAYSMFVPFYVVGSILLMLVGNPIAGLAAKLAHPDSKNV